MNAWMTYNPNCGTARNVRDILRQRGIEPEIREYLKAPLTRAELAALAKEMNVPARAIVRWKEKDAIAAAGIAEDSSDDALLDAMAAHPILLNRPIVRTDKGIKLCRPSETVDALL
jgi:arsenate reductase